MMREQIVILDFGSQYTQVIARRIRECNVYSTILRYDTPAREIAATQAPRHHSVRRAVPASMRKDAPLPDRRIFKLGMPMLGICYGVQLFAQFLGGKVEKGQKREYGKGTLTVKDPSLRAVRESARKRCRSGIRTATSSRNCRAISNRSPSRKIPNTRRSKIARGNSSACNFIPKSSTRRAGGKSSPISSTAICGCGKNWTMRSYIDQAVEEIRAQVGKEKVILGLSGGVDSSVAAALLHKAIGDQLTCIFVNNGVLRGREAEVVQRGFRAAFQDQAAIRKRLETVSATAQRRDRSGTQTQDHRPDVHRGFSGGDEARRARRSFSRKARFIPT